MAKAVLDASAVLAFLRQEPGQALVRQLMPRSLVCAVNLTEIIGKLIERGADAPTALRIASSLPFRVISFGEDLAADAGVLWGRTRPLGLSLGDRACLALAEREKLPAVTSDRRWAEAEVRVTVKLIR